MYISNFFKDYKIICEFKANVLFLPLKERTSVMYDVFEIKSDLINF